MNQRVPNLEPTASNAAVRRSGNWMVALDDRILEALNSRDADQPYLIAMDVDYGLDVDRVVERLRILCQAGYVAFKTHENDDKRLPAPHEREYSLTIWGELYLDGRARADAIYPQPHPQRPGYVLG